ncbi:hypothetical protein C8R47DRAFT_1200605 [Mycena vitilis]|nr:hypothetical protein C8R47DRAFT_1200605 [Mycena vitilis]
MARRKITPQIATFIETAGQNLFRYTRALEVHTLLLQKDLNAAAVALAEYVARNPRPAGFMPSVEEDRDAWRAAAEAMLSKDCQTATDHLEASNASLFLARMINREAEELDGGRDWIYNEVCRKSTALRCANPLPYNPEDYVLRIPENPHPLLQAMLPGPVAPVAPEAPEAPVAPEAADAIVEITQHQDVIRCLPFEAPDEPYEYRQINRLTLAKWRKHPEQLYGKIFVSDNDGEEDLFRVDSFVNSHDSTKIFYVQMVEDEDGLAFSEQSFFDLLAQSRRVVLTTVN